MNSGPRIVGPSTYVETSRDLVNTDHLPAKFDNVIDAVIRLLLNNYSGPNTDKINQAKFLLTRFGVWGYNNVYWNGGSFYIKEDRFGLGRELDRCVPESSSLRVPVMPSPPYKQFELDPRFFGEFTADQFVYSQASEMLGDVSGRIHEIAKKNDLAVRVKGLNLQRRELLVRTVCSLEFKSGMIIVNLGEDETRQHMGIGEKIDYSGNPRFNQITLDQP